MAGLQSKCLQSKSAGGAGAGGARGGGGWGPLEGARAGASPAPGAGGATDPQLSTLSETRCPEP